MCASGRQEPCTPYCASGYPTHTRASPHHTCGQVRSQGEVSRLPTLLGPCSAHSMLSSSRLAYSLAQVTPGSKVPLIRPPPHPTRQRTPEGAADWPWLLPERLLLSSPHERPTASGPRQALLATSPSKGLAAGSLRTGWSSVVWKMNGRLVSFQACFPLSTEPTFPAAAIVAMLGTCLLLLRPHTGGWEHWVALTPKGICQGTPGPPGWPGPMGLPTLPLPSSLVGSHRGVREVTRRANLY